MGLRVLKIRGLIYGSMVGKVGLLLGMEVGAVGLLVGSLVGLPVKG